MYLDTIPWVCEDGFVNFRTECKEFGELPEALLFSDLIVS